MLTTILAAALFGSPTQVQAPGSQGPKHYLDGVYKLYWDDEIDGQCINSSKATNFTLRVDGSTLHGEFLDGLESGKKAKLVGRFDEPINGDRLLSFRQIEPQYVCSYQIAMGPETYTAQRNRGEAASFMGVWHDTNGRRGDFILLKYQ